MFITTIDDANATTTNSRVATAATGPTVYIHLPSSTPILIIIMIVIVILFLPAVFLPTVYFEQGGLCSCLFSFLIRQGSIVIHTMPVATAIYGHTVYSIRSFVADFFDGEICYCFSFLLSTIIPFITKSSNTNTIFERSNYYLDTLI